MLVNDVSLEHRLFYRALLQKRLIIVKSLLIVAHHWRRNDVAIVISLLIVGRFFLALETFYGKI